MANKLYELTDEHRKQLKPWADRWTSNAMSTKPMDNEDRRITREAIKGLYVAANLIPPPDHRIVFVSSPFVGRFAAGFAAAIWHQRKTGCKDAATSDATYAATRAATRDATLLDKSKWYQVDIAGMIRVAHETGAGDLGLRCAQDSYNLWQGGNQWSAWVSYLSFFRHVAKLPIDYSKFDHWEKAAIHSGPRWMHKEFCIISDRPEILTVNERNQPYNSNGPFCKWRDGTALYSMSGVRVPAWTVETPINKITKEMFVGEKNADIRRELAKRIGISKVVELLGAEVIDSENGYELLSVDLGDKRGRPYLKMKDASIDAFHIEGCHPSVKTVKEAICYRNGLSEYVPPVLLT